MREWRGRRMRWSALTHRSIRLASVLYLIDASVFVWRAYHSVPIALVDPDDNVQREVAQMHDLVLSCPLRDQVDAIVFAPEVTPVEVRPG